MYYHQRQVGVFRHTIKHHEFPPDGQMVQHDSKRCGITRLHILILNFFSMQVFLSLGHNNAFNFINDHGKVRLSIYRDQGAVSGDDTEFKYSQKIANEIKKLWNIPGVELKIVPEGLNLQDRIKYINANSFNKDICIELHMDSASPSALGCSTWYISASDYAEGKAKVFQMEYTRVTGIK